MLSKLPRNGSNSTVLPSSGTYETWQSAAWQDVHKGAKNDPHMSLATNNCLIGLRAHSTGGKSCLKIGIQPGSWSQFGHESQKRVCCSHALDQIILYYIIHLIIMPPSKCSYNPSSNSIFLQQIEIITENYDRTQCRDYQIMVPSAPLDIAVPQFLHLRLRKHLRRGSRNLL